MIIKALIDIIYNVFSLLTTPINIPSMPEGVQDALNSFLEWMTVGLQLLANYTHLGYLVSLFGIVIAVDLGITIYKLVMWVLRKIPVIGVS